MAKKKKTAKRSRNKAGSGGKRYSPEEKSRILGEVAELRRKGKQLPDALAAVGVSIGSYYAWQRASGETETPTDIDSGENEETTERESGRPIASEVPSIGDKAILFIGSVDQVIEFYSKLKK